MRIKGVLKSETKGKMMGGKMMLAHRAEQPGAFVPQVTPTWNLRGVTGYLNLPRGPGPLWALLAAAAGCTCAEKLRAER